MEKLSEVKVGTKISMPLVALEVSERKTRANKPYLAVKLSDGTTQMAGNFWDWEPSSGVPERGNVFDVVATVGDWQGVPQLNIMSMEPSIDADISDFIPSSGVDVEEVFEEAMNIANVISDKFLNRLTCSVLNELKHLWLSVPGAKGVHHAYQAGALIHSLSVAKLALNIVRRIPEANESLVVAGALLHDVGKLFTYGFDGAAIDYTDEGQLYEHIFIGAEFVGNFAESNDIIVDRKDERKLALLRHIILSHHGVLEYGSPVTPKCIEAYIVHHADAIDASVEQIRAIDNPNSAGAWTDKIWALSNMKHVKPSYINNIFAKEPQQ